MVVLIHSFPKLANVSRVFPMGGKFFRHLFPVLQFGKHFIYFILYLFRRFRPFMLAFGILYKRLNKSGHESARAAKAAAFGCILNLII